MAEFSHLWLNGSSVWYLRHLIKKPVPKDNEALVKAYATTVTAGDIRMQGFKVPASLWLLARISLGLTRPKRKILGMELSGKLSQQGKKFQDY